MTENRANQAALWGNMGDHGRQRESGVFSASINGQTNQYNCAKSIYDWLTIRRKSPVILALTAMLHPLTFLLPSLISLVGTNAEGTKLIMELRIAAAVFAAVMIACAPAQAKTWLKTGGAAKTPFGHYEYCKRGGRHCGSQRDAGPAKMTQSRWAKVRRINTAVNRQIKPVLDINSRGVNEYWEIPKTQGDCEDFALLKRSRMMAAGFKASQLPLTKTRLPNGQAHIVLVVRTDEGDYVLDNLSNSVRPVDSVGYRFLSMQAANNANSWLSIRGKTQTAALQ